MSAIVLIFLTATASADLRIVTSDGTETLVTREHLRITLGEKAAWQTGIEARRGRVWIADRGRRMYWEGGISEYCGQMHRLITGALAVVREQLSRSGNTSGSQHEQELKKLSEQLRIAEEQLRAPARRAAPTRLEPTDETATIAGFETRRYRVLSDGRVIQELWVTTDVQLARELDLRSWPQVPAATWSCLNIGGSSAGVESTWKVLEIGWPLKSVTYEMGSLERNHTYEAVSVERRAIPEAELRPPATYKRVSLEELLKVP